MNVSCFRGLVGIRQDSLYDIPRTSVPESTTDYLYSSSSGLWVNSLCENLINLKNLQLSAREHEDVEQYLVNIYDGSVSDVINTFETYRSTNNQTRTLLSNNQSMPVIRGAGSYQNKITKSGRFVFLEIIPAMYNTVKLTIQSIGFQFDSAQTDLPIYLYKSDQFEPVLIFNISGNNPNSVTWMSTVDFDDDSDLFDENGVLQLSNHDGERYFLGYYESDLTGYAIRKDFPTLKGYWAPCGCTGDPYETYSRYFDIRAGFVTAGNIHGDKKLFDIDKVSYESVNYGLNFKPFVECTIENLYCQQKKLFARALQHQYAIKILEGIWSSPNINQTTMGDTVRKAGNMTAELKRDLMGYKSEEGHFVPGIIQQLNVDLSGLDPICMKSRSRWEVASLV